MAPPPQAGAGPDAGRGHAGRLLPAAGSGGPEVRGWGPACRRPAGCEALLPGRTVIRAVGGRRGRKEKEGEKRNTMQKKHFAPPSLTELRAISLV